MGGPGASVLLRHALTQRQEEELETWLHSITRHLSSPEWTVKKRSEVREFWLIENAFPGKVSDCLFYLAIEDTTEGQHWNEEEKSQVKELLGYLPEQFIGVSSGCNQDEDHITLGQFVLHLARMYDGLIDIGGAITPPRRPLSEEERALVRSLLATAPERRRERDAYLQPRLNALKASLPPGKTWPDMVKEFQTDPASPLRTIMDDMAAKFGPVLPPDLSRAKREPSLDEISAYVMTLPGKAYGIEYTVSADRRWVFHIVDVAFLEAWLKNPDFYMVK